jgi:hypothetical protein
MRTRAFRTCVDLDTPTEFDLLKTYLNAKGLFGKNVKAKQTGHGYHLRIYQQCASIEKNLDIRRSLGDDPNRIGFDEERQAYSLLQDWIDTCFQWKRRNNEKPTHEEECNILALPAFSRFPARKPNKQFKSKFKVWHGLR